MMDPRKIVGSVFEKTVRFVEEKYIIASVIAVLLVVILILVIAGINPLKLCQKPVLVQEKAYKPVYADFMSPDYQDALARSKKVDPLIVDVSDESTFQRKIRLKKMGVGVGSITYKFMLLNSPVINEVEDRYSPVRFMHKKHASVLGDCTVCHHYRSSRCDARETEKCSTCHQKPFDKKVPDRVGLKAAYHLQCLGCHREMAKGPTGCTGCHTKNIPDHSQYVKMQENLKPEDVTKQCLKCHEKQGKDILHTAHWRWEGPSYYTEGREREIRNGKATNTINNFCIHIASNYARCTSCHIGYGWKDKNFNFNDKTKIDCLVCHDTTGTYTKTPTGAGMPDKNVDLLFVAKHVGMPSRFTCGKLCHFVGGGGDAVKHADLSSTLLKPSRNCDIHMGGYNFQCQDCHKTKNHKIAGRSFSVPVAEGIIKCENCHSKEPHYGGTVLDHHLNKHSDHVACNTCHTPLYSKCISTKSYWDWSKAGDKNRKPKLDKLGNPDYNILKGEFTWVQDAKPEYAWFSGKVKRHLVGDIIPENVNVLHITEPVGDIHDGDSRIFPFKIMRGKQPADLVNRYLLIPHLFGKDGYWKTFDWQSSFKIGMKEVNMNYSGQYYWVETKMYWGIEHEVTPKELALSCVQCHASLRTEQSCNICHKEAQSAHYRFAAWKNMEQKRKLMQGKAPGLVDGTDYINFRQLGYAGDPIIHGGRFSKSKVPQEVIAK